MPALAMAPPVNSMLSLQELPTEAGLSRTLWQTSAPPPACLTFPLWAAAAAPAERAAQVEGLP